MIEELYCPSKKCRKQRQKYMVSEYDIMDADITLLDFLKNWLGMYFQVADELVQMTPEERKELLSLYDLISDIRERFDDPAYASEYWDKLEAQLYYFFRRLLKILPRMWI